MNAQQFLAEFGHIANAPGGVARLREMVLGLAISGRLIEQAEVNQGLAADYLRKLEQELADYKVTNKYRRTLGDRVAVSKLIGPPPTGWVNARLGQVGVLIRGVTYNKSVARTSKEQGMIGLLRANNIGAIISFDDLIYVPSDLVDKEQILRTGDVLIAMSSGSKDLVGKAAIVKEDTAYGFGAFCGAFRPMPSLQREFVRVVMQSPQYREYVSDQGKGIGINNLTKGHIEDYEFFLPPSGEQSRIVAKVDELMALCDRLEADQADAEAAHAQLVQALLDSLTQATDAADFRASWQRLSEHFHTLFTTEASIDALKQTVLQLAVMGRLVPQSPSDESASVLMRRIQAEGKGARNAEIGVATLEDESGRPMALPAGWSLAPFGSICSVQSNLVRPEDFMDSQQLAPDCIEKGTGRIIERRTVRQSGVRGPNCRFFSGQIVYSKIRPSLSKAVLVDFDGLCSADMYPINSYISPSYQLRLMLSEVFLRQVRLAENRVKMPKLNQESLNSFVVPIPPLPEQHRIVAKVDELMALCDQLKTQLIEGRHLHDQLATALVEKAALFEAKNEMN